MLNDIDIYLTTRLILTVIFVIRAYNYGNIKYIMEESLF